MTSSVSRVFEERQLTLFTARAGKIQERKILRYMMSTTHNLDTICFQVLFLQE